MQLLLVVVVLDLHLQQAAVEVVVLAVILLVGLGQQIR
jgi:hypothetical protein